MRFVLAVLLAIAAVGPARAQGNSPQPGAQQSEEIIRQRILLRERFNKGWDVLDEDPRQRRARCKSEARKQYSAMHPLKRRKFMKECIAQPRR